jgi:hypothetical protein
LWWKEDLQEGELTLDNHASQELAMEHRQFYYSGGPFELIDTHITDSQLILNQPPRRTIPIQIFK